LVEQKIEAIDKKSASIFLFRIKKNRNFAPDNYYE